MEPAEQPAFSLSTLGEARLPAKTGQRPAIKRQASLERANLITLTFAPGQVMPNHSAAHPILVQVMEGTVDFEIGEELHHMVPGVILYVPAYVRHEVRCPDDAEGEAIFLLTMLTGE